jgi:2-polyprenyl-6-methoxyphenol hydroxylase-like FAD-dependent oxidoreductase
MLCGMNTPSTNQAAEVIIVGGGPLGWLVPNWCIRRAVFEEFGQRGLRLECGAKVTRFALVGDAAVGMHPVTAHGYNLGLYSIEALARRLGLARGAGWDPGSAEILESYAREHRRVSLPIYHGTNAIVRLFTRDHGPALTARRAVLAASQRLPLFGRLVRSAIRGRLMGASSA